MITFVLSRSLFILFAGLILFSNAAEEDCTLECIHGECRLGEGNANMFSGLEDVYEKYGATENLPFLDKSSHEMEDGMHCACDAGYVGKKCEVPMEMCSERDGAHTCFNHGKCEVGVSDLGNEFFFCDCSKAGMHDAKAYAGHFCDKAAQEYCAVGGQSRHAFCVHGTCASFVNPNEEHPGCICDDGYEGSHCEFPKGTLPEVVYGRPQNEASNSSKRKLEGGIIFLIVLICGAFVGLVISARRMGRIQTTTTTTTGNTIPAEAIAGNIEADGSGTIGKPEAPMENEGGLA